jgi:TRAP-type C4-dicarboxylate transport system permease small subunit
MTENNERPLVDPEEAEVKWSDYQVEDYVSLAIFWVLILLVLLQVISRYVFKSSIIWSEEMARYHFIVLTFIGAGMIARHGSFIKIEFFMSFLPSKVNHILTSVVNCIEIIFLVMATGLAWQMFLFMCTKKMVSVNVSMGVLYGGIFIGFLLVTFRTIQIFIRHLRQPVDSTGI